MPALSLELNQRVQQTCVVFGLYLCTCVINICSISIAEAVQCLLPDGRETLAHASRGKNFTSSELVSNKMCFRNKIAIPTFICD